MQILDQKPQTSKSAEWEQLRRELLRRIVQNEAQRRSGRLVTAK
jgi:hypothetical protein